MSPVSVGLASVKAPSGIHRGRELSSLRLLLSRFELVGKLAFRLALKCDQCCRAQNR